MKTREGLTTMRRKEYVDGSFFRGVGYALLFYAILIASGYCIYGVLANRVWLQAAWKVCCA